TKQDEAFFHKNKKWKTCQSCIEQRAAKKARTKRKREEEAVTIANSGANDEEPLRVSLKSVTLMELAEFVANEVRAVAANPQPTNPDGIKQGLNLRVALNLTGSITGNENPKEVARWIVEEIERADEYNWTYNCMNTSMRHKDVAKFYYVCSQSMVAMKEYKQGSNRKRMERFPCQGKMQMKIDLPAAEAMLEIHHGILHSRPVIASDISDECKKEIEQNLGLNPISLRAHLRAKGVMKNYTPKQIHLYWEKVASTKNPASLARISTSILAAATNNEYTMIPPQPVMPYIGPVPVPMATVPHMVSNPISEEERAVKYNRDDFAEYVNKIEQFAKRVRTQLEYGNYLWLEAVKGVTSRVIEMENDIEELERLRANEQASKPWVVHYK
ncbi:7803_t:CDS:2, partial [Paraglomus brasilianum]